MRCREEHRYAYLLKIRPRIDNEKLTFAAKMHELLADFYTVGVSSDRSRNIEINSSAAAQQAAMMALYREKPLSKSGETTIKAVEMIFEISDNGHIFAGKIDLIVMIDQKLVLVEHKTTSSNINVGEDYWTTIYMDDQISNYIEGAMTLGYKIDRCIYDVLKRPTLRKKSAETFVDYYYRCREQLFAHGDQFLQRRIIYLSEEQKERAQRDRLAMEQEILSIDPDQQQPRTVQSCRRYGSLCPYLPLCLRETGVNDERYTRIERKHIELC